MKKIIFVLLINILFLSAYSQTTTDALRVIDTRNINDLPNFSKQLIRADFKLRSTIGTPGSGTISTNLTIAPWKDYTGDLNHQLSFNNGGIYYRTGDERNAFWNTWQKISLTSPGSFYIAGDENTYYPVVFEDKGWDNNEATVLEINRSDVHGDKSWSGSLMSRFKLHVTRGGHGANFIDVDIKQKPSQSTGKYFIAGWQDITTLRNFTYFIIWLRGATTYYYQSNYPQTPLFTSSSLTFEGTTHTPKTEIDSYVNNNGLSLSGSLKVNSTLPSSFAGNVGIGTITPKNLLDVAGTIHAKNIEVDLNNWSDFVFDKGYQLPSLIELEAHIKEHKHLPNIPSEAQVKEKGINIGEMQVKLLQKIEELTLYVIQQEKRIQEQENSSSEQKEIIKKLQEELKKL